MTPSLRRLIVICAGIAAMVLTLIVLISHPANTVDLLAGAGLAAGVGLVVSQLP